MSSYINEVARLKNLRNEYKHLIAESSRNPSKEFALLKEIKEIDSHLKQIEASGATYTKQDLDYKVRIIKTYYFAYIAVLLFIAGSIIYKEFFVNSH